ncbi:DNA repair nuclease, XPF-type/Helicase [Drechmeria coniospora]|uniref:Crossover junction endonuclease MUS81 n=1 Tax=Drechmeria coniospora TaxID=98403 RepID=A0A151GEI7_DRECN|nr:DNA repair nuclease, XPF-type/Helicase [Drechmeria coniospora]KYK55496.1 DNA repair nuclease, XPF-type/Helicase [Drechmeria coniospora]
MADDDNCANRQFLAWVKEWLDVARQRSSKGVTTYKNAYDSLKACPLTFQHPSELQQLKGFGPKLCERLTENLQNHCQQNGLPMPERPGARKAAGRARQGDDGGDGGDGDDDGDGGSHPPAKRRKPRQPKAYVPTFRSGAYALVIGLSTLSEESTSGMTKTELIQIAQPHCDSSLTVPSDATKTYTAWSSMKTLIQKELVYERGRPLRRYALTDEGWHVARRIKETRECRLDGRDDEHGETSRPMSDPEPQAEAGRVSRFRSPSPRAEIREVQASPYVHVVPDGPPASGRDHTLPDFDPVRLPPGSFTVHLVLDVREVRARTDRDYIQEELAKQGVKPIMRSLEVGDAQWVAKLHDSDLLSRHGAEGDEVVLDWIVERKRLDDLVSSIKDGRFHEQKFRLGRSGVRKVIYIIEEITMDHSVHQRYDEAIESAMASMQVVNGYFVKRTAKMDETIRYLSRMTALLKRDYEGKTLNVIPTRILTAQNYLPLLGHLRTKDPSVGYYISYPAFASLASKSELMTLRDVFLKMLMTTRGITGERALAIQKRWKTPHDLVKAFDACGPGEQGKKRKQELVSSELDYLAGRMKISKALSGKIAEVWGDA